jgi:hypothetical protein
MPKDMLEYLAWRWRRTAFPNKKAELDSFEQSLMKLQVVIKEILDQIKEFK